MEPGQPSEVYFEFHGDDVEYLYFRINPIAIRFDQSLKGAVNETLGGYYRELIYADDRQHSGLTIPNLTVEGTTGVLYRKELARISEIWKQQSLLKSNNTLPDLYFYDLISVGNTPDGLLRDRSRGYLVSLERFSWDETVNAPFEVKFSFALKILRDLFWEIDQPLSPAEQSSIQPLPQ